MAVAKPLIPSLSSHHPSKLKTRASTHHHLPWLGRAPTPLRPKRLVVRVTSSSILDPLSSALVHHQDPSSSLSYLFLLADSTSVGYSTASYYTSLGLFVISVPGLWSLIKRSVKSKVRYHFIQDNFFLLFNEFLVNNNSAMGLFGRKEYTLDSKTPNSSLTSCKCSTLSPLTFIQVFLPREQIHTLILSSQCISHSVLVCFKFLFIMLSKMKISYSTF